MKITLLPKTVSCFGSAFALAFALAGPVFAGPGPQYWQQQAERAKARAEITQIRSEVAANSAAAAMACPHCRTSPRQEPAFYNPSGKIAPRTVVAGTVHSCDGCRGTITQHAGRSKDEMKRECPICAKAPPNCCPARN